MVDYEQMKKELDHLTSVSPENDRRAFLVVAEYLENLASRVGALESLLSGGRHAACVADVIRMLGGSKSMSDRNLQYIAALAHELKLLKKELSEFKKFSVDDGR